jgi:TRAP-type C4-dicarboxylate transport system permease small subunit
MVERQILDEPPPPPAGRLGRVLRIIEKVEVAGGALLLVAILVLVMVQVLVRITSFAGWVWTGELARFGLMWMAFVMAGYLLGRGQHITFDFISEHLPVRGKRVVDVVSNLIVAAICIGFVYEGWGQMQAQSGITSTAAKIPMTVVYAVPTVGFALTALRALANPFMPRESA